MAQIVDSAHLPGCADSLARRADAVAAAAEVRAAAAASRDMVELSSKLDPSSLEAVFSILKQQNEALRALEVSCAPHHVCKSSIFKTCMICPDCRLCDCRECCIVTTVTWL